jgi:outer membrane protein TolC
MICPHRLTRIRLTCLLLLLALAVAPGVARAQDDGVLRLADLRAAAAERDPRAVQPTLLRRATALRLDALRASRRPSLAIAGQGTLQSDVPSLPSGVGAGAAGAIAGPPEEQFSVALEADWTLYDGGQVARQANAERARLAEELAGTNVSLYALREATTDAFFAALMAEARAQTLDAQAQDLEARFLLAKNRAEAGTALPADAAALRAELLRVRQDADAARADRRAALGVVEELTGVDARAADRLALPDLSADVRRVLAGVGSAARPPASLVVRPEVAQLSLRADRLRAEADVQAARLRPQVSLFGEAGVGRPGPFNLFSDQVNEYGLVGLRLRWSVFDWGQSRREAEALRVQARVAEAEAEAVARQAVRATEDDRAALDRLQRALDADAEVVELREEALRVARRQLDEGVVLPDTYTDRLTDLADARLRLEQHRVERARAQARLLSDLGQFPER